MHLTLKKSLIPLIATIILASISLITSIAYAGDQTVDILGQTNCDGTLSDRCGWGGLDTGGYPGNVGGNGQEGGGNGGGGGGSAGTSMNNNRQPECQAESDFINAIVQQVAQSGKPVGQLIPITVTDPQFQDGQWIKMEVGEIHISWSRERPTKKVEYKMVVHYMYNVATHQVFQTKLKNTYEYGCLGIEKTS